MTAAGVRQRLRRADRLLADARAAILAAMADNDRLPRREQYGGMELAGAADRATDARRLIEYAGRRNGYGQPRQ